MPFRFKNDIFAGNLGIVYPSSWMLLLLLTSKGNEQQLQNGI